MISRALGALFLSAVFVSGAAEAAADKPKPTPSAEAQKTPEPVSNDPQTTTASYGDWIERCQRLNTPEGARRLCEVAETVTASGQTAPLAEIAVGRLKKGAALRVTIVLPVNVAFPSTPKITAAGGDPVELAWKQCVPSGCFAEGAFSSDAQQAWRAAKTAKVESRASTGAPFNFEISLRGLPQALDALAREP